MGEGSVKLLKREDIPERYRWDLEEIYPGSEAWEKDFRKIGDLLKKLDGYKGKLGSCPETLLGCLKLKDEIACITDKLYVYSHMHRDEDNSNHIYQALADRAEGLNTEVEKEFSFVIPEILSIPEDRIEDFMQGMKDLSIYRHHMDEIRRMRNHILPTDEEKIVSMAGDITSSPENIYRMLCSADMKFPTVRNEKGEVVELSEGRYYQLIRSKSREVRKEAFQKLHETYGNYSNTFAASLNGAVKKDIFYARVKKYDSSLEGALDNDNIPVKVYENVINTVNENLKPLHRYMDIRKRMLKVDKLHMYDLYAPMVDNVNINIPYEQGMEMVEKSLKPLGQEYVSILARGFNSRWVDVYENQGKTHGAYSWGSYGTHPYVLLNYSGTLSDVSTIAHEMGHSMHSFYSRREQPYIYANYTLFSAEVASTTNEALFTDYLLKTTEDMGKRKYIITQYLETIRTTFYRQTMFAEFEKVIHEKVEAGEALTSEVFCRLWHDINSRYYGPDVVVDQEIEMEWARISHFYRNFYVYKYVTGFSAAVSISKKILENNKNFLEKYLKFLKNGDSDYSINLLRDAGVDMTEPAPLLNTVEVFKSLLDMLENE